MLTDCLKIRNQLVSLQHTAHLVMVKIKYRKQYEYPYTCAVVGMHECMKTTNVLTPYVDLDTNCYDVVLLDGSTSILLCVFIYYFLFHSKIMYQPIEAGKNKSVAPCFNFKSLYQLLSTVSKHIRK